MNVLPKVEYYCPFFDRHGNIERTTITTGMHYLCTYFNTPFFIKQTYTFNPPDIYFIFKITHLFLSFLLLFIIMYDLFYFIKIRTTTFDRLGFMFA